MNGQDFNIIEGDLHLRDSRIEQLGFDAGVNVTLLSADFAGGLSPFSLITTSGQTGEWIDTASSNCFNTPCARASRITPQANSIMEANFTTTDFDTINVSFRINTTNLDAGDLFNVTVNNNVGSGEFQIHAIADGTDENQLVSVILPVSMEDKVTVTLRYLCNVNVINEQCFVDDVMSVGEASISTLTNVTLFDTTIKGGSTGSENIFIFYNDTSKQWIFSPNNVSFVNVIEVDLTVTNTITLNTTTIGNWSEIGDLIDFGPAGVISNDSLNEEFINVTGNSNKDGNLNITDQLKVDNITTSAFDQNITIELAGKQEGTAVIITFNNSLNNDRRNALILHSEFNGVATTNHGLALGSTFRDSSGVVHNLVELDFQRDTSDTVATWRPRINIGDVMRTVFISSFNEILWNTDRRFDFAYFTDGSDNTFFIDDSGDCVTILGNDCSSGTSTALRVHGRVNITSDLFVDGEIVGGENMTITGARVSFTNLDTLDQDADFVCISDGVLYTREGGAECSGLL